MKRAIVLGVFVVLVLAPSALAYPVHRFHTNGLSKATTTIESVRLDGTVQRLDPYRIKWGGVLTIRALVPGSILVSALPLNLSPRNSLTGSSDDSFDHRMKILARLPPRDSRLTVALRKGVNRTRVGGVVRYVTSFDWRPGAFEAFARKRGYVPCLCALNRIDAIEPRVSQETLPTNLLDAYIDPESGYDTQGATEREIRRWP